MHDAIIYYFCTLAVLYVFSKLPRLYFLFFQFQGFSLRLFPDLNSLDRIRKRQELILNTKPQKNELVILHELQGALPNIGRHEIKVIEKPDPKYNKRYRKLPHRVQITLN